MKKIHLFFVALLLIVLPKISLSQSEINWDNVALGPYTSPPPQFAALGMVECVGDNVSINPCSSGYHNWLKHTNSSVETFGQSTITSSWYMKYTGDSPGIGLMIKTAFSLSGPWTPVNFSYSSNGPCYTVTTDIVDQGSYLQITNNNNKVIKIQRVGIDNGLMPVELMAFSASRKNNRIQLKWKTATETNCFSFVIEQSLDEINWTNIGTKMGQGTVNTPTEYFFDTEELSFNDMYYRLRQLDRDGTEKTYQTIKVASAIIPNKVAITAVYPNPITSQATIIYRLNEEATINMLFTNIEGRFIDPLKPELNDIIRGEQKAVGSYSVNFIPPATLPSGIYFIHLTAGKNLAIHKLIIIQK